MRFLFISTKGDWGGSEPLWCEAAERALQEGHEVVFVLPETKELHARHKTLLAKGAHVVFRPKRQNPTLTNRIRWKIAGILQPETQWWREQFPHKIDAICVSQGGAYCAFNMPGLVNWLKEQRNRYYVICQSTRVPLIQSDSMRQQIGDYYSHAARVGFTALGNKKEVEVHLASEIANSFIHQNPIDFSAADIIPWPQASQALISCPSRLFVEDKGQDILLQVLASEHWASRDFKLHFFGDGPDEAYISNLAKHLGIAHKVEFCGKAEGMLPIWHKTHLVVLPSRSEGVPLVLVGAMAAGRPSVVTDVGGNAEWIRDNRDGFVARMSNVWAFSEALERAWENRHRWREMGEAARETCLAKRDPDPAGTLLALLRKAAEREGKAETLKS